MAKTHKILLIIIFLIGCSPTVYSQNRIFGTVVDQENSPLPYVQVVLLHPADSTLQYYDVSDKTGDWEIAHIRSGDYLLQYSFVTKKTVFEPLSLTAGIGVDLGIQVMEAADLKGATVTAEYVPIQFKQDTVTFNAKAFTVKTGAVVEDLLKKIPGVEVDKAGNIKALGEDVTKVLVDGKEFFDSDPKVATKNLPARSVDKVEVFDKLSEEAEFTGISDGIQDRTINLLLNEDSKKGYFGDVAAGGGRGDSRKNRYTAGGKLYRFSSTIQSALLGNLNNVNEFGFSGKEHKDFGREIGGLNTTASGGLNLSLNTGKPNRYFFSYLVSSTETGLQEKTLTEHFIQDGSYYQDQDLDRIYTDTPHRVNLGIRHNFSADHRFIFNGNISVNPYTETRLTTAVTTQDDVILNEYENKTEEDQHGTDVTLNASNILKYNEGRTQFITRGSFGYTQSDQDLSWQSITTAYNPDKTTLQNQFQDNSTKNLNIGLSPNVVQQLRPLWYIDASLGIDADDRTLDKKQGLFGQNVTATDSLSALFTTLETRITPSLALRRADATSQFKAGVNAALIRFNKQLDGTSLDEHRYLYLLPFIQYNNAYRSGRRIGIKGGAQAIMPGLNQLLPIANTINQLSVYTGNIDLRPEIRYSLQADWSLFDHFSFTSLFVHAGGSYTHDKVSLSQTINEDYTVSVVPVNVNYQTAAWGYVHFSTPLRGLGFKVNSTLAENFSKGISIINSQENIATGLQHRVDLNVENRRKEHYDFRIGGSVTLNDVRYSVAKERNSVYFNTAWYSDLDLFVTERFEVGAGANIVNYNARSFRESVQVPLIEARLSYHFLPGKRASLVLRGYDLLNKYANFQRISDVNYLMEQTKNVIGRYVMLTFRYRTGK
ncbi:TonB-dependent receptor [bacterium]|nr:TonB-dependent receptor [bacterium]